MAMIVGAVVVIGYTLTGGFLAVSMTDLIQSIIMSIALVIVLLFGINQAGGWAAVVSNAQSLAGHVSLSLSHVPDSADFWAAGSTAPYGFLTVVSTLAWGLGYFGMPHILLRFMAIEDEKKLTLSRRIASIWVVIAMGAAILIGMVGLGMSRTGTVGLLENASVSETIIVEIAHRLSTFGFFPALLAGLILSGIMASTMSTADSQLLAASSSVSKDILTSFFHVDLPEKKLMNVARASLFVIAVIGVILAWNPNSSVFRVVSFAWAGFVAAFGPIMLLALFWKRSNRAGATCGMIAGGLMVFVWKYLIAPMGGAFAIYELLPAFLIALIVDVIVSLVTAEPSAEIQSTFDKVKADM
jgi:sodium/proline symporter